MFLQCVNPRGVYVCAHRIEMVKRRKKDSSPKRAVYLPDPIYDPKVAKKRQKSKDKHSDKHSDRHHRQATTSGTHGGGARAPLGPDFVKLHTCVL